MHQEVDLGFEPLFENDSYAVVCVEADDLDDALVRDGIKFAVWYEVINLHTGVPEYKAPVFVECVFWASQQMALLRDKSWEWYDKKGSGTKQAPPAPSGETLN